MSGNLAKVRKRPKVRESSGNMCSQGNLIVATQRIIYLYFIPTVTHFSYMIFVKNLDYQ